ncbi:hypothetical protein PS943_04341 [Pseudomonas fluorescens]|uniref:Uncharacterized protein n=1 Tax=Pseudomonas fluorescens TaxID=294 RepID=A0A5E7WKT3_PSEFL|nr:hypothetical protein PS943_04341 [Pseudomonas fluorescens]
MALCHAKEEPATGNLLDVYLFESQYFSQDPGRPHILVFLSWEES